jgi:hypothetical protein
MRDMMVVSIALRLGDLRKQASKPGVLASLGYRP